MPSEGFVGPESAVERNGLDRRADIAGAVDCELVFQPDIHFPKCGRLFEQVAFRLGCGEFRAGTAQSRGALALLAVMMGEKHPVDLPHADFTEVIQDRPLT